MWTFALLIASAGITGLLPARARTRAAVLAGLATVLGLIGVALRFPSVQDGARSVERLAWVPDLGLELVIRFDGLSWVFAMLILGIGALVVLYARYYLSPTDPAPRFYAFLLAFIAS